MTFDLSTERIGFSLLLLLSATLFLFWSRRRRAQIQTVRQVQLLFACGTGLVYGLFRIWIGCGLVLPAGFK